MQVSITLETNPQRKIYLLIDKRISQGKINQYRAKAISHDIFFSLKVFPQTDMMSSYDKEKSILSQLRHQNIINYFPLANHNIKDHIILTEHASNGSFFDFIKQKGALREDVVRTYFHQLVNSIEHMHSKGIVHCDVRLENLLLDRNFSMKLSNFEQARDLREGNQRLSIGRNSERGRNPYQAFFAADLYSLGIVLFALKTGKHPFIDERNQGEKRIGSYDSFCFLNAVYWKIKEKDLNTNERFSFEFKELMNGLCAQDIKSRYTIKDIKASKWYNGKVLSEKVLKNFMESL